jgi:acetyl-CoA carboxylase carboxyltransferase component
MSTDHQARLSDALARAPKGNLHKEAEKLARQGKLFVRADRPCCARPRLVRRGRPARQHVGTDLPSDGVVTGVGEIDGRPVSSSPTIRR